MVTLLKENNVAMTKLMKSCQEAARQAQEWNRLKPCPNFKEMENQIVVLRNADEEIAKSEERNRMQMEDFTEEMESQKKNFDELLQSMETDVPACGRTQKIKGKRKGADQRGQLFYYSTEKLLSVLDEVAAALARAQLWR